MALTAAQIVTLATQIAKVPNYTSQAGQLLNVVLQELCQTYNTDAARGYFTFDFSTSSGSGPYYMTADYLRMAPDGIWYTLNGVKYFPVSIDLSEFDAQVQTAGNQAYPVFYATDTSTAPVSVYFWAPPSGAYPVSVRYFRQMPDITTPESSATVPWFPNTNYLITRLAGELMKISGDKRADIYLGPSDAGAQGILNRYLKLEDDDLNRSKRVQLDRRYFGRSSDLPNTKLVGW
jgi:hypothetical protein